MPDRSARPRAAGAGGPTVNNEGSFRALAQLLTDQQMVSILFSLSIFEASEVSEQILLFYHKNYMLTLILSHRYVSRHGLQHLLLALHLTART